MKERLPDIPDADENTKDPIPLFDFDAGIVRNVSEETLGNLIRAAVNEGSLMATSGGNGAGPSHEEQK